MSTGRCKSWARVLLRYYSLNLSETWRVLISCFFYLLLRILYGHTMMGYLGLVQWNLSNIYIYIYMQYQVHFNKNIIIFNINQNFGWMWRPLPFTWPWCLQFSFSWRKWLQVWTDWQVYSRLEQCWHWSESNTRHLHQWGSVQWSN